MNWLKILVELGQSAYKVVTDTVSKPVKDLVADEVSKELADIRKKRQQLREDIKSILQDD